VKPNGQVPKKCDANPSLQATAFVAVELKRWMADHAMHDSRFGAASRSLTLVKTLHTLAWAVFAGCIVAIPLASWQGAHRAAAWLAAIVFAEVLVLAFNKWSCPLTAVAARYTEDRRPNFDIYLPEWLARYNKQIFGSLYVAGLVYALAHWAFASNQAG
jgi:hypothetical protein